MGSQSWIRSRVLRTQKYVPSVENQELTNVHPLKPGVGQNIAMHASLTARIFFLVPISTFSVRSIRLHLFLILSERARRKIGPLAHSYKQFRQIPVMSACGI